MTMRSKILNTIGSIAALLAVLEEDGTVQTALQALERSLRSLEAVEEVRFLVDGEFRRDLGPFDGEEE